MNCLQDIVEIDKSFQNSVNLELDLNNASKIDGFIHTQSADMILEHYRKNVEYNREQATVLIGPYGKGKSQVLLVLLNELAKIDKPYLPVIVSGTAQDLNQAFLYGITEALKRNGLEDITPAGYYSEAVRIIRLWEKDFPLAYEQFQQKLTALDIDAERMIGKLEKQDEEAMELFQKIYPSITNGSKFNPIVNTDISGVYREIIHELVSKYNYSGIYVVFDEFSKYIEGHEPGTFAKDMKIVQDMCELANSSKDERMFITFVAHKSIREYGATLSLEMRNAFTGVEGRIKEVLFVVSSQNNYELINAVIRKKNDFANSIENAVRYCKNADRSYELHCFKEIFAKEEYDRLIKYGCFPLMPVTAYLLLAVSEKVGQNERSVFTYLANDEKGTLYRAVNEYEGKLADAGITADCVYDYFSELFKDEYFKSHIHNEWLKSEYALSLTNDCMEQKFIKIMAVISITGKSDELPINSKVMSAALNISESECEKLIAGMVTKKIIVFRSRLSSFVFCNKVGVDIEEEIKKHMAMLPARFNICTKLEQISELDFILPKKYNEKRRISRFFQYVYMTDEQLLQTANAEYLFENKFSDGKIIAILRENEKKKPVIPDTLMEDSRLVFVIPDKSFDQSNNVKKYAAVEMMLSDSKFMEDNKVLKQELESVLEDISYDVNQWLMQSYVPDNGMCTVLHHRLEYRDIFGTKMSFNAFLSMITTEYYPLTPVINNELINRQNISTQNKKARDKIVEQILGDRDFEHWKEGSSPEATIYRATMVHTGILPVSDCKSADEGDMTANQCSELLGKIKTFIAECGGNKKSFMDLYDSLMGQGLGIRRGVIPIYLATAISELQGMPVIYLGDKEVEFSIQILNNINDTPEKYSMFVEEEEAQKTEYIDRIENVFGGSKQINQANSSKKLQRIGMLYDAMYRWYCSLPLITMSFNVRPDSVQEEIMEQITAFRKLFKLHLTNPHELLFSKLPGLFEGDYIKAAEGIVAIKNILDNYLDETKKTVIKLTKQIFQEKENTSLCAMLTSWYNSLPEETKSYIGNTRQTNFLKYLSDIRTNDEKDIVNRLSKTILDMYIEDWNDSSMKLYEEALTKLKEELEEKKSNKTSVRGNNRILITVGENTVERYFDSEEDSTTNFFGNAIDDIIDDFGDSLEVNQKVAVLVKALEKLMKE